jgi:hypothetical protein
VKRGSAEGEPELRSSHLNFDGLSASSGTCVYREPVHGEFVKPRKNGAA